MNQSFFCMRFKPNNLELYAEAVEQYDEQKLIVGETGKETLNVKKSQGRKAYDIVRLQDVFNFLISPELKRDLELANLTGWSTYEIKSDDIEKGYSGFICNGKCGTPNKTETSGFKLGFNFDIKIWDDSDFLYPKLH
jgi:hypothetical protein